MTCSNCNRVNLPGGLRCAYCGAYLPTALEFDLGELAGNTGIPPTTDAPQTAPKNATPNAAKGVGLLAPLVILLMKAKSLLALLKFGKIFTTLVSMLVFIWVDAQFFGWRFGVGIAVCIFIHEMGHVFVNWRYKLPQSAPVFIPFMGAAIFLKNFPDNPQIQSESGAGGPVAGFLAAIGCYGIYGITKDPFWLGLAHFGFAVNLFNLIPFPPLDGSHIHSVFSPGIWNAVLATMVLWALKVPSSMLWMIIIVSLLMRFSHRDTGRYLLAPPNVRARMAILYVLMCITMAWASDHTISRHRNAPQTPTTQHATSETTTKTLTPRQESIRETLQIAPVALSQPESYVIRTVLWIVLMLCAVLLWAVTTSLLRIPRKRSWSAADGRFFGGMVGTLPLLVGGLLFLPVEGGAKWSTVGAYFAGTAISVGFAIFCAVRKAQFVAVSPVALRMRTSAAMATGAFLVAYGANGATAFLVLLGGVVAFYGMHRWMVPASLGWFWGQLKAPERARLAFSQVASQCPDAEEQAHLWGKVAGLNLELERGKDALDAVLRQEQTLSEVSDATPSTLQIMTRLERQAISRGLIGQFDQALIACEQILQTAGRDPRAVALLPVAELIVHFALARFAFYRGWHDEVIAQVDWCLKNTKASYGRLRNVMELLKGDALLAQATATPDATYRASLLEQAEQLATAVEKRDPENSTRAHVATLRTQVALLQGKGELARTQAKHAAEFFPANLAVRYWHGRVIDNASLATLATEFPEDYWGRRAAEASPASLR